MNFLGGLCADGLPSFLWIFNLSVAPPLLFYSYIPIIIASTIIGFFVFFADKRSLQGTLFLSTTLFFVLWVINILVQWVAAYHSVIMFAWQITAVLETGIFFSALYFPGLAVILVYFYPKFKNSRLKGKYIRLAISL